MVDLSVNKTWVAFYGAIKSAIRGEREEAISALKRLGDQDRDILSHYLAESMRESDDGITNEDIFKDNRVYEAVTSQVHFRQMRESFANKATNIMSRQGLDDKDYYVLDIGVGDGKQLCEIIRKDSFGGRIHLAILDPSERLLEKAVERLMDLRDARIVEIRKVFDRIENITVGSLLQLFGCPMHAAIASNSLHHVPYEQKGPVLSVIRGVCKMLLLHELDAEHDRPERGDDALIYSVWRVFNKSIELTLGGDLLSEYKEIAIKSFFVPEARNILLKPRAERGDYHTTKEQWADLIADGAGEIGACEDGGCELVESACTFESGPMKMQFQAYAFGVINPA